MGRSAIAARPTFTRSSPGRQGLTFGLLRLAGDSSRPGLIVKQAHLDPRDIARVNRIPATSAARAILECAAILPANEDDRLEQMWAEAHALRLVTRLDLEDQIARNSGKRGVARLRGMLDRNERPSRTKRELESRLLKLVRASDVEKPETNAHLNGREVDMLWRDARVVVEADSYRFHSHSRPWAKDIGKSNELQLLGYIVLRFTWFDVSERPGWVVEEIRRALRMRGR